MIRRYIQSNLFALEVEQASRRRHRRTRGLRRGLAVIGKGVGFVFVLLAPWAVVALFAAVGYATGGESAAIVGLFAGIPWLGALLAAALDLAEGRSRR